MKEQIEHLNHLSEILYEETKGRCTISRKKAKDIQSIIDEMQEKLDKIANELYKPEI